MNLKLGLVLILICASKATNPQDIDNKEVQYTEFSNNQTSEISEEDLKRMMENGELSEVGFSQSGLSQGQFQTSFSQESLEGLMIQAGEQLEGQSIGLGTQSQVLYSKPEIIQTQEMISQPVISRQVVSQPIITKKIISQPIIKQRVVQTPIIRKKSVTRPIYTEEVQNEPIVDSQNVSRQIPIAVPGGTTIRERYVQPQEHVIEQQLNVQRQGNEVVNHPEVLKPTEYTEEVITKQYDVPSREVFYQPIYQKEVVNNKEEIELIPQEDQVVQLDAVTRQPIYRDNNRVETVQRPGREIYNQALIQPVVQRERVDVQINRQPDQEVVVKPIIEGTLVNNVSRTETVQVPGKQFITQPIIQEYYQQQDVHHVQNPVFEKIEITRAVPVPTPYVKKVPIIRKIPVPVPNKKSVPDTKLVNETNVKIVGYQKTKPKVDCQKENGDCQEVEEPKQQQHNNAQGQQQGVLDILQLKGIGQKEIQQLQGKNVDQIMYALQKLENDRKSGKVVQYRKNYEDSRYGGHGQYGGHQSNSGYGHGGQKSYSQSRYGSSAGEFVH